ncbi:uncharacterized protein LOC143025616 [Oratosquilla oratoria]|uniref:uncharacterized protein LOC143025616 n=1 Tax=Oratosquilla oratoria TaxID=337810 RepID=UPI003F7726FC
MTSSLVCAVAHSRIYKQAAIEAESIPALQLPCALPIVDCTMRFLFLILVNAVLGTMAATINKEDEDECPSLYNRLWPDGPCVTAYELHKTSWEDAKHFCNSIFGQLIVIEDADFFTKLVSYFEETGIQTNFWIGGHKTQDGNWTWIDDTAMPMGVPFWTVR